MPSQVRKTILDALVSQIDTDVAALNFVTREHRMSSDIADDEFPACVIWEGPTRLRHDITQETDIELDVACMIMVKDDPDSAQDIWEAIIDSLNGDPTIGGTCLFCLARTGDPAIFWPVAGGTDFLSLGITITYRRLTP